MSKIVAKDRKKNTGSPQVVGEIDTSAPFQSVKDAVNLFGEGAFSGEKPSIKKARPHSAEKILAKETKLHLAEKELNKLKEKLKNAETTKAQALVELEWAKLTVDELNIKLKTVSELKESATKETEAAKNQVKQLEEASDSVLKGNDDSSEHDLENARKRYSIAIAELDAVKQELRSISQDCDASLAAKFAAIKHAEEAEQAAKANEERVGELSKEIASVQESIGLMKLATTEVHEEEAKIYAHKDIEKKSCKANLEDSAKKLLVLKKDFDPEVSKNLESQLKEAASEIEALQNQMEFAKASDLDSVTMVTSELDGAKESLHKVAEEESFLRSLVESLKLELENIKKEHSELKEKEAETESVAGNLHVKLRKAKHELEVAFSEESKVKGASEEMISTLHQLVSESETAKKEAEEMKKQAEELKKEAESTKMVLGEAEKKLRAALEETEEAKAAEARALEQIKILSDRTCAARTSTSESGSQIRISREEFESISRKVEEADKLAEMKVAAAVAQVEAVKASENEALKRLEALQQEIIDMKVATQDALKKAENAEAAKKAVEGELRRWRERDQKKAAEAASRILAETQMVSDSSPQNYYVPKPTQTVKTTESRKHLTKAKTSVSKKVLMPNLSGMFHRKRNQVEGGSPSYLPGEKHY